LAARLGVLVGSSKKSFPTKAPNFLALRSRTTRGQLVGLKEPRGTSTLGRKALSLARSLMRGPAPYSRRKGRSYAWMPESCNTTVKGDVRRSPSLGYRPAANQGSPARHHPIKFT
jgi:hypothetical protein